MNKKQKNLHYYIQQVADMTGLTKQVIRKWEERHELVQPERLTNGYRIYSEQDISILLSVKALAGEGYSLKQATEMVKAETKKIPTQMESVEKKHFEMLTNDVFQMLAHGVQCDEAEINLILQQAFHRYGLEPFLSTVVIPFLKEVGERWEKGEWDEYQEAVSSLVVRDFLVQIRRNYQSRENAPLLLGACLPDELHEVPLHIVMLRCMARGWNTMLIGSSPALGSIQSLVKKMQPKKVVLSATTTIPFEKHPNLLAELDQFAAENKKIDFYLGGKGALDYTAEFTPLKAIQVTQSIDEITKR